MQVQELVGIVPWTFIAQICNLFLQVYLIKRFLFKPINNMLAKRKELADAQIQEAVKAKEEAETMKSEYEQGIRDARNKANEIVAAAQKTAAVQSGNAVILSWDEPAVFVQGGLHGKLVVLKSEVGFGGIVVSIFRAYMLECCQQHHLPFSSLQISEWRDQRRHPVIPLPSQDKDYAIR